jgi:putative transposase
VIRRTWAPRGQTPVLRTKQGSWRRASALGALAYSMTTKKPRLLLHFTRRPFRKEDVLRFVKHLARHVRGRIVLVWDNLGAHKCGLLKEWLAKHPRVRIVYLPPYAPELNPVEALWAWLKGTQLANVCDDDLHPILARVRIAKRNLRRRPRLLRSFLAKAGLAL